MNALSRIRLGLLTAKLKLERVFTMDWEKDPNPENWRTISGAHVHLENGKIDGGAGGKFAGNDWVGKKMHASDPRSQQGTLFGKYDWTVPPNKKEREEAQNKKDLLNELDNYHNMTSREHRSDQASKISRLMLNVPKDSEEYKKARGFLKYLGWSDEDIGYAEIEKKELQQSENERQAKLKSDWEQAMAENEAAAQKRKQATGSKKSQIKDFEAAEAEYKRLTENARKRNYLEPNYDTPKIKQAREALQQATDELQKNFYTNAEGLTEISGDDFSALTGIPKDKVTKFVENTPIFKEVNGISPDGNGGYNLNQKGLVKFLDFMSYRDEFSKEEQKNARGIFKHMLEAVHRKKGESTGQIELPQSVRFAKTPEGQAERWFYIKEQVRSHGSERDVKALYEAAQKERSRRIGESARVNHEIDRLHLKSRLTKEDEAKLKDLQKERSKVEHEERAFQTEFDKFKQKYGIKEEAGAGIGYKVDPKTGEMVRSTAKPLPGQARETTVTVGNVSGQPSALERVAETRAQRGRGKWNTVASTGSKEDLEKMINEYYHSTGYKIKDDGTVYNENTGKTLSLEARQSRGRWQFGKYEKPKEEAQPVASQPEEKQYLSPLEAVAKMREMRKAQKAEAKPATEKPKSAAPKKKGNARTRLEDVAKEVGINLEEYRTAGGKYDKRNSQNIKFDDMPKEKADAFKQALRDKGYTLSWNGGLGTAVKEPQERKATANYKPTEKTAAPEGYEEYLKRKNSGEKNSYEESQEARRERYENRSAAATAESQSRWDKAHGIASNIPFGQPILVGHHSERRHRADINRIENNMQKGYEAGKKAEYYANKAEAVGSGGISSLDPDAKFKVYEKLRDLENLQDKMKEANAKTPNAKPYASYQLVNNSAEIRRLKKRLEDLSKVTSAPTGTLADNSLYELSHEDGRYQFRFDGKPSDEVRSILKSNGFKWSPSRGTWVRASAGNGERAMQRVQEQLKPHVDNETIPNF